MTVLQQSATSDSSAFRRPPSQVMRLARMGSAHFEVSPTTARATVVPRAVRHDPEEPRPEWARAVEALERTPGSLRRELHHVICSIRASEHDRRDPERGESMAGHQGAIGIGVAFLGAPHGHLLDVVDRYVLVGPS